MHFSQIPQLQIEAAICITNEIECFYNLLPNTDFALIFLFYFVKTIIIVALKREIYLYSNWPLIKKSEKNWVVKKYFIRNITHMIQSPKKSDRFVNLQLNGLY